MSYIYLDRDIASHPLWSDKPFARGQAWVDLILQARFANSQAYIRGIRIDLKRGELALSQEILANRWGWSRGKVARFLDDMQDNSEIDRRQYNRIDIITICKYEEYQTKQATDNTTDSPRKGGRRTADGAHNKKGKKGKECSIQRPQDVSESVWNDFKILRDNKSAPITDTVISMIANQASIAGISLEQALTECCARNWQAFKAEWYKNASNQNQAPRSPKGLL